MSSVGMHTLRCLPVLDAPVVSAPSTNADVRLRTVCLAHSMSCAQYVFIEYIITMIMHPNSLLLLHTYGGA